MLWGNYCTISVHITARDRGAYGCIRYETEERMVRRVACSGVLGGGGAAHPVDHSGAYGAVGTVRNRTEGAVMTTTQPLPRGKVTRNLLAVGRGGRACFVDATTSVHISTAGSYGSSLSCKRVTVAQWIGRARSGYRLRQTAERTTLHGTRAASEIYRACL